LEPATASAMAITPAAITRNPPAASQSRLGVDSAARLFCPGPSRIRPPCTRPAEPGQPNQRPRPAYASCCNFAASRACNARRRGEGEEVRGGVFLLVPVAGRPSRPCTIQPPPLLLSQTSARILHMDTSLPGERRALLCWSRDRCPALYRVKGNGFLRLIC